MNTQRGGKSNVRSFTDYGSILKYLRTFAGNNAGKFLPLRRNMRIIEESESQKGKVFKGGGIWKMSISNNLIHKWASIFRSGRILFISARQAAADTY